MQKAQITNWLNADHQNWQTGIALLSEFSPKKHLIRVLLSKGNTPKSLTRIRYELTRIAKARTVASAVRPPVRQFQTVKTGKPILKSSIVPPIAGEQASDPYLADMIARKNKFHQEGTSLKHQLEFLTQPHRGIAARNVLKLFDSRDALWRQIDYYVKFKIKPPDLLSPADPNLLELIKRRDNLRTYISKLKKKIADVTKAKSKARYEIDLGEKILELNEIEKKINS